jgi:hypothetical protein
MDIQQVTYDVSRHYLQDRKATLPLPVFNTLHGWIRARDFRQLAACVTVFAPDVTGVEATRTLHQMESFFKKNGAFADALETRLAALLSFEEGEELCRETNERLDIHSLKPSSEMDFKVEIKRMQRYIQKVLGDHRDFLERLPELVYVTSGATATRSRRNAIPFLKISKKLVCTPGAVPYLSALSHYYGYGEMSVRLITRNRVAFVPKSWKTDRTIACEAEGNSFLQLAFDKYAKGQLRKYGIDLYSQTRNQELAKEGSIFDNLSTIDLSMASDTLAYNTVALLFPGEWFQYLRAVRSQYHELYPGSKQSYHKFSSMGNGATFAIETLVFAAACSSMVGSTYSVYGDDIIISRDSTARLIELLAFLGFIPNTEKTFTSGPFRESCGKFWYQGFDITPKYIRGMDSRKATQCHLINTMVSIGEPYGHLWKYLRRLISEWKLPFVPYNEDSMSGVWIHPHFAYAKKLIRTRHKTRGRDFSHQPMMKAFQPKSWKRVNRDSRSLFLWYLGTVGKEDREPFESSRYTISSHKYVRKWVHWSPVVGAPDNNYLFSEELFPEKIR